MKENLEEAVTSAIEKKQNVLIIENDYWFFGIIKDYLRKYNINNDTSITSGLITLENGSLFTFRSSQNNLEGIAYDYIIIN